MDDKVLVSHLLLRPRLDEVVQILPQALVQAEAELVHVRTGGLHSGEDLGDDAFQIESCLDSGGVPILQILLQLFCEGVEGRAICLWDVSQGFVSRGRRCGLFVANGWRCLFFGTRWQGHQSGC